MLSVLWNHLDLRRRVLVSKCDKESILLRPLTSTQALLDLLLGAL